MDIKPAGSMPTRMAPADYFTGAVYQEPIVEAAAPARANALVVTFTPGARTAWHTHPLGQTLFITAGSGLVQTEGGPVRRVRAGDVVSFAPGEKHWHGAAPTTSMTHIAIQEAEGGRTADWMEQVSDSDYTAEPAA
jgi:quercetin dioxygenase-like cupin family protein